jgi:hypothetical protein
MQNRCKDKKEGREEEGTTSRKLMIPKTKIIEGSG